MKLQNKICASRQSIGSLVQNLISKFQRKTLQTAGRVLSAMRSSASTLAQLCIGCRESANNFEVIPPRLGLSWRWYLALAFGSPRSSPIGQSCGSQLRRLPSQAKYEQGDSRGQLELHRLSQKHFYSWFKEIDSHSWIFGRAL